MNHLKVGICLTVISASLLILFIFSTYSLNKEIEMLGCFQGPDCSKIEQSLSLVHLAFGFFGFLFALGFYLIAFNRGEEAIIQRLEADTLRKLNEEKFAILLKGLDEFEKEAIAFIRNEEGITQTALSFRTTMSKAKLSQTLSCLERKGLIHREKQKKTYVLRLKEKF